MTYLIRDHDKQTFIGRGRLLDQVVTGLNDELDADLVTMSLHDQYYNLKDALKNHMEVIEIAKEAMGNLDIKPDIYPVRGGTDGSAISYKGLPAPSLFTDGGNIHSRFEYVSLQMMECTLDTLFEIARLAAEGDK